MTYAHFWPNLVAALRAEAKADDHRGAGGLCRDAADEIERLRAALKPFADFADMMERNSYREGSDLLLRQHGRILGHAGVQPETMFEARAALNPELKATKEG